MARLPRLDLPGIPQHLVQRGNNRLPCFLDDQDRIIYLSGLHNALREAECHLHAYVLMDNHVHLLVTPPQTGCISRMMQRFARQYSVYFNKRHSRTGSLWEGRYKSCLVDTETYLLRCIRYIDLNPVRARMVGDPATYPWSSCAAHLGRPSDLLTPHPVWLELGRDPQERAHQYRTLLDEALPEGVLREIRLYLQQQRALGSNAFQDMVTAKVRRFSRARPAHRPVHIHP